MIIGSEPVSIDAIETVLLYHVVPGATIRVTPEGDGFSYGGQTVSSDGRYIAYQGTNGTDTFVYIYGTDPSDTLHYHQQVKLVAGTSPAVSGDGSTILVEHGGSIGIHNLHGDRIRIVEMIVHPDEPEAPGLISRGKLCHDTKGLFTPCPR